MVGYIQSVLKRRYLIPNWSSRLLRWVEENFILGNDIVCFCSVDIKTHVWFGDCIMYFPDFIQLMQQLEEGMTYSTIEMHQSIKKSWLHWF